MPLICLLNKCLNGSRLKSESRNVLNDTSLECFRMNMMPFRMLYSAEWHLAQDWTGLAWSRKGMRD